MAGFRAPSGPEATGYEPPTGLPQSQASAASPWLAWLLEQRERGLSAKRIQQDLPVEHPAAAAVSYDSVRRLLKQHGAAPPVPFRRMGSPPGFEAQVDFGTGAAVIGPDGRRRKTHVIRVVLSHSRRGRSEAVSTQSTDDVIQCLENAFEHFGGVPHTIVIDNLKAGVLKADWFDPEFNPKLEDFCRHYGTTELPTKPRTPRHKGKVERGVDYVQENALKGRTFPSLDAQHLDPTKINGLERGIAYLLGKVRSIGPQPHAWAEAVVDARGIEGHRVVQGLLSLTRKHTCAELERACEIALANQCYRRRLLRQLIARQADRQQPLEFLASIRSSGHSTTTPPWSLGRSIAARVAHPWAKGGGAMAQASIPAAKTVAPQG